jgi:hypothetical protein
MKRQLEAVHVGRCTLTTYRSLEALLAPCLASQPRPHRRRGRPCKNLPNGAGAPVMAADIDLLVPEAERTAWRGIRATGGLPYA